MCMSSKQRVILTFGGRAPKSTNLKELWRLTIWSDGTTSCEPYASRHYRWPYAKPRRPSGPSGGVRFNLVFYSRVGIESDTVVYLG